MSLARIAIRTAVVEALKGQTRAGDGVYNSMISAIDIDADGKVTTNQEGLFISVYTEVGTSRPDDVRDLYDNGTLSLVIEWGISSAMFVTDKETGETTLQGFEIPTTDEWFETLLDLIGREIIDTLTDGVNDWSSLFQEFTVQIPKHERRRAANDANGTRVAAHQMRLDLEIVDEPVKGDLAGNMAFTALLDQMRAAGRPDLSNLADMIEGYLTGEVEIFDRAVQKIGLTTPETRGLMAFQPGPQAEEQGA